MTALIIYLIGGVLSIPASILMCRYEGSCHISDLVLALFIFFLSWLVCCIFCSIYFWSRHSIDFIDPVYFRTNS